MDSLGNELPLDVECEDDSDDCDDLCATDRGQTAKAALQTLRAATNLGLMGAAYAGLVKAADQLDMREPLLYLVLLSHLSCLGAFQSFLYAVSYGYGLSLLSAGAYAAANQLLGDAKAELSKSGALHSAIYAAYGLRMISFIWARNTSTSYRRKLREIYHADKKISLWGKFMCWTFVSLLMTAYGLPVYFNNMMGPRELAPVEKAGHILAASGLLVEAVADVQKAKAKATHANAPITSGLFRVVRHPNYLGEIMFHAGVFLGGWEAYDTPLKRSLALVGPALMSAVMVEQTALLSKKQLQKYGRTPRYRRYLMNTPALLPLPLVATIFRLLRINETALWWAAWLVGGGAVLYDAYKEGGGPPKSPSVKVVKNSPSAATMGGRTRRTGGNTSSVKKVPRTR